MHVTIWLFICIYVKMFYLLGSTHYKPLAHMTQFSLESDWYLHQRTCLFFSCDMLYNAWHRVGTQ